MKNNFVICLFILLCVAIGITGVSCTMENYNNFNPEKVITFEATTDSTPADGVTYLQITAVVADTLIANTNRSITFSANQGTFANSVATSPGTVTTQIGPGGTASCFLKSSIPGPVTILATISTLASATVQCTFVTAWPTNLTVSTMPSTVPDSNNSSIAVTAYLLRPNGIASQDLKVCFYDSITSPNLYKPGIFSNVALSNSAGQATATYVIDSNKTYAGIIYINAKIALHPYDTLYAKNKVVIAPLAK